MRALLIEDNFDLSASISDFLETKNVIVDFAYTAEAGYNFLKEYNYDVILMDINLPDYNGFQLCSKVKEELLCTTPIIMLTARSLLEDKLSGFSSGADDYLVKPFEMEELLARMTVLSQRERKSEHFLEIDGLSFNIGSQLIKRENKELNLNPSCIKILKILMQKHPQIVSKSDLEYFLWGEDLPETNVLKIHIHTLRQVIDKPFNKNNIQSIRGAGYCFKS